jgi:hypothetical protein
MKLSVADNNNEGQVAGIAFDNRLGQGIVAASLTEPGPGGSWSTCMIGCASDPPADVAHIQFRSRIAFKLGNSLFLILTIIYLTPRFYN